MTLAGRTALITGAGGGWEMQDEVANACLFLAAESSGFITAEILDVNGGMWGD